MTRYKQKSIEDEGIDNYLNRTVFDHGGVDFELFVGLVERGVNTANLMKAMNIKTRDTMNKYIKIYQKWKLAQPQLKAEQDAAIDSLRNV